MGFGKNKWLKIWEITKREDNYTEVRASTSKKKKDGEYETDFSGFVRLISDAHKAASALEEGDRIRIQACETTNVYDKEKGKTYWNCAVFKFDNGDNDEDEEGETETTKPAQSKDKEDDMPW